MLQENVNFHNKFLHCTSDHNTIINGKFLIQILDIRNLNGWKASVLIVLN